jgi:hypothetical protein
MARTESHYQHLAATDLERLGEWYDSEVSALTQAYLDNNEDPEFAADLAHAQVSTELVDYFDRLAEEGLVA